jgi:hypothetical protein
MKKVLFSLGACALASSCLASVNLNLDHEYWDGVAGSSVTIYGTIDLTPGWDATTAIVESASNGVDGLTTITFHPDLIAYLGLTTSASYSGGLFTVDIPVGATPGLYDFDNLAGTGSDRSEFGIVAKRLSDNAQAADFENYGINVRAVPEPTSLAALGVGVLALRRRRR